ncbi:MAG: ATP synthase F1 subunit gamma, partial [Bacteroidota bacterium]
QQVTKAMKMVAAAKLRRAQDRIIQLRPYATKLQEIIGNVVSVLDAEDIPSRFVEQREGNKVLVMVITSNRGLAGPFNANIIKHTVAFLKENHPEAYAAKDIQFLCLGRKGHEFFKKSGFEVNGENRDVFTKLSFEGVNEVVDEAFEKFLTGEVDKVYVMYNEFKNVMTQIRRAETLLPLAVDSLDEGEEQASSDYIFEPAREEILTELIPRALRLQVFRGVLESNASEQGARMVAMDSATENAEELLKDLKLKYNKARQAAITKEILEIAAGADALVD